MTASESKNLTGGILYTPLQSTKLLFCNELVEQLRKCVQNASPKMFFSSVSSIPSDVLSLVITYSLYLSSVLSISSVSVTPLAI